MYLRYKILTFWKEYLEQKSLFKESPLSDLENQRIAIDVSSWLRQQIIYFEPFQPAMGGIPLTWEDAINKNLADLQNAKITPIFVFSGIALEHNPFAGIKGGHRPRTLGWQYYESGEVEKAKDCFIQRDASIFARNLFPIFVEKNIQFMQAPYSASAQLCWFSQKNIVNGVFGAFDLIPFPDINKIITSINFQNQTYTWINPKEIQQALGVNRSQFVEIFIYSAAQQIPVTRAPFTFNSIEALAKQVKINKPSVVQSTVSEDYMIKRCFVHTPVLEQSCNCEPLVRENSPKDLHEIFGLRFPAEIYFLLSQGVISTQVVQLLSHSVFYELPPLNDTQEYRRLLDSLVKIRAQTLSILAYQLNPQFLKHTIKINRWFDQSVYHPMDFQEYQNLFTQFNPSPLLNFIDEEKTKSPGNQVDLRFVVNLLALSKGKANIPTTAPDFIISSPDQLLSQVYIEYFRILEYTNAQNEPGIFIALLSTISAPHQEYAIIILELLKFNSINSKPLTFTEFREINKPIDSNIALLSRVLSLLPLTLKEASWQESVDLDLMGFNSLVKAVNRSLRNLLEIILSVVLIRFKHQIPTTQYSQISYSLPFFQENNTAAGIVIKHFLYGKSVEELNKQFPTCLDIKNDLKKAFEFWDQLVIVVNKHPNLDSTVVSAFHSADAFQKVKRSELL